MSEKLEAQYGLPEQVVFCKRCVISNQRPSSYPEFKHTADRRTPTMRIDSEGVCDACRFAEQKEKIDWESREKELLKVLDKYRRNDGYYDCVVPGSGGKDSAYAAHVLKYKYGMHPLTVTWSPTLYTDYGRQNFENWIDLGGFDNIAVKANGRVHRLLTRLAVENLLHPFQTFILGQKNIPVQIAMKYGIPLMFYGENEAEYGNPIAENAPSLRDEAYHTTKDLNETYLGGVPVSKLIGKYRLSLNDIWTYLPADYREFDKAKIEVHYLGYYLKWTPQESYYYAVEHTGFKARPFRSEGTHGKYSSIDDKMDDLHWYTTYIKFGLGRCSYESSQEIRNKHLTREEGIALVRRFDGEFPQRYFREVMDYISVNPEYFIDLCDKFRSPHLWKKENGDWHLRHQVS